MADSMVLLLVVVVALGNSAGLQQLGDTALGYPGEVVKVSQLRGSPVVALDSHLKVVAMTHLVPSELAADAVALVGV